MLNMISGWLAKAENELTKGVDSADATIEKVKGEKSTREQALNEAEEAVEAQIEKTEKAQRQLNEVESAEVKAEEEYVAAQHEVEHWDEEQATKAEERDECKEVIDTMGELKDIPREQHSREKKRLNYVLEYLRKIGVEETLIATIPPALGWGKANSQRGRFDDIALEEVQQRLDSHHKNLDERANGGDELKDKYIAEEAKKKELLEEAREKKKASAEAAKAEEDRVDELAKVQVVAKDAVMNFYKDVKKAHEHKASLAFNLAKLTTEIKDKFEWLLKREGGAEEGAADEEDPAEAPGEEEDQEDEEEKEDADEQD